MASVVQQREPRLGFHGPQRLSERDDLAPKIKFMFCSILNLSGVLSWSISLGPWAGQQRGNEANLQFWVKLPFPHKKKEK